MYKLLFSTIIVLTFFTFSIQAQRSYRLQNLANDLQRNAEDVAENAYNEFTRRYSNSRGDIDNLMIAQQLKASADMFRRMVYDNRSDSELRDASNALNDLARRYSNSSYSSQWRQLQRNLDDINREVGGFGGGSGGGWGNNDNNYEKRIGSVRWRGKVDNEVHLKIRNNTLETSIFAGQDYGAGTYNFVSSLPNRNVNLYVNKKKGRGSVTIIQQPDRFNDYTAVIKILDDDGGAKDYDVEIYWTR